MPDPELDPALIARLARIGGPDLVRRMIDTFLEEAPARQAALTSATTSGDLETLAGTAHTIVAGAGQLGATTLAAEARSVEEAVRRGEGAEALRLAPALTRRFAAALTALAAARETA